MTAGSFRWMGWRTLRAVLAVACIVMGGSGCADRGGPATADDVPPGAEPTGGSAPSQVDSDDETDVAVTRLARLPAMLTGFDSSPDGRDLLVGDRQGVIYRFSRESQAGTTVPVLDERPILDLSSDVSTLGERGFFDLKLADDGRWLLVNYTALDGTITVERFPYRSGARIERSSGEALVALPHPYAWHHGGGMAVAESGDVFVAVGDMEFRQLDPPGPQDPSLMLGGILRIPADAVRGDVGDWTPTPQDMVARGLRNPWRISLDAATGDLWIGDVGLDSFEEIDIVPGEGLGSRSANFGWPYFEGDTPRELSPPDEREFSRPVLARAHNSDTCGMVHGFRYRGRRVPALAGHLVYGDLCGNSVRSFAVSDDGNVRDDGAVVDVKEPIVSFGQDAEGELYLLGSLGGLYRLDPGWWTSPDSSQGSGLAPYATTTVPRSTSTCDGIVAAVAPLAELGSMSPDEASAAIHQANRHIPAIVAGLPAALHADGILVQEAFSEAEQVMAAAGWDPGSAVVVELRSQARAGLGLFAGFPEAMARIVDSECG